MNSEQEKMWRTHWMKSPCYSTVGLKRNQYAYLNGLNNMITNWQSQLQLSKRQRVSQWLSQRSSWQGVELGIEMLFMGRRRRLNGDTKNGGGKDDCCVCPQIRHTRFPLGKIIIIERKRLLRDMKKKKVNMIIREINLQEMHLGTPLLLPKRLFD